MTLDSTLKNLKIQIEDAIADCGKRGVAPPMHLLQMRSYLMGNSADGFDSTETNALLGEIRDRLTPQALTPDIKIIDITEPDKEFSVEFDNIKILETYCRSNIEVRYSFESGVVENGREYRTLPAGASQPISLAQGYNWSGTLYLAASVDASKPDAFPAIVEVESWR